MAVARFAADLARSLGLQAELQIESWNGLEQANVIVRPSCDPQGVGDVDAGASRIDFVPDQEFMLETHLDTPDPGAYALWRETGANPFNASIYRSPEGDRLYGLGSADVKLDFLCKLYALREADQERRQSGQAWNVPPVLVGTFGEELGMPGAVKLIRKKKVKPTAVLVGEPTDSKLVVAGKGFASVEIEIPFSPEERRFRDEHNLSESSSSQSRLFRGRAAHSSSPQLGESAIEKMFDALERMPSGVAVMEIEGGINFNTVASQAVLEIDLVAGMTTEALKDLMAQKLLRIRTVIKQVEAQFKRFPDSGFVPQEPTLNVGMIRTLEEHVKILGCVRLPPTVSQADYEGWMQMLREACAAEGAVFRIGDYKPPFRTAESSAIIENCRRILSEMQIDATLSTQAVANEANVFAKFGIDCAVWGPGQGVGNSHTPNEYVRIQELDRATGFYRLVIKQMCL
jgi:succinyl-diaminopimelate desuccinylase